MEGRHRGSIIFMVEVENEKRSSQRLLHDEKNKVIRKEMGREISVLVNNNPLDPNQMTMLGHELMTPSMFSMHQTMAILEGGSVMRWSSKGTRGGISQLVHSNAM